VEPPLAGGIVDSIQPGGSYEDPLTGGSLSGPAIAQYAGGLFKAFPDLSFELISAAATGPDSVAAQWVMRGTNTGPLQGALPPARSSRLLGRTSSAQTGTRSPLSKATSTRAKFPASWVCRLSSSHGHRSSAVRQPNVHGTGTNGPDRVARQRIAPNRFRVQEVFKFPQSRLHDN